MNISAIDRSISKNIKSIFKMGNLLLLLIILSFMSLFFTLYCNTDYLYLLDYKENFISYRIILSSILTSFFQILTFSEYILLSLDITSRGRICSNKTLFSSIISLFFFYWLTFAFYSSFLFGIALTPVIEALKISGSSEDMLLFLNKIPIWVLLVDICLLLVLLSWICIKRKKDVIISDLNDCSNVTQAKLAEKYSSYYVCLLLLVQIILFIFFKNIMISPFYFFAYIAVFLLILTVSVSFIRNSTKTGESFLKLVYLCLLMPSFFVTLFLGIYSRLYFDVQYFELTGKHLLTNFELLYAKFITNPSPHYLIFAFLIILISFLVMLIFKKKEIVIPLQLIALMFLFLYLCQKDSFISFMYSACEEIEINGFWLSIAVPITYALPFYFSFQKNDFQVKPYNNSCKSRGEMLHDESKIMIDLFRKIIYWFKKAVKKSENVLFFLTLLIANFVAFSVGILLNSSFFYIFLVRY